MDTRIYHSCRCIPGGCYMQLLGFSLLRLLLPSNAMQGAFAIPDP